MDNHNTTEQAYRNGYEAGKRDAEPKWIPVNDMLPKNRDDVLVVALQNKELRIMVGWYAIVSAKWHILTPYGPVPSDCITHWMPFPNPPTE